MKKSELRDMIREEIQRLNEMDANVSKLSKLPLKKLRALQTQNEKLKKANYSKYTKAKTPGEKKLASAEGTELDKMRDALTSAVDKKSFKEGLTEAAVKGRNNKTGESFGVVIGSLKSNRDGNAVVTVRTGYSARLSEADHEFDENGHLMTTDDKGYSLEGGPIQNKGYRSEHYWNPNKKETMKALGKLYTPAFAKRLVAHVQEYIKKNK